MSFPKKINLNFIDQVSYLQGFHRSGWPFVLRNLMKLHSDDGIWCDTYVDRTFHWARPSVIPYTRPWVGFVHHTFDTSFSDYNNVNLLKDENFLRSLPFCKGLFVFSSIQQKKWTNQLRKRSFIDVPVVALTHPTSLEDKKFDMTLFQNNDKKRLVQIGAWLRDNYAIYTLNNGRSKISLDENTALHKSALVGPQMSFYYKPPDFFRMFRKPQWKKTTFVPPLTDFSAIQSDHGETPRVENSLTVNAIIPAYVFEETRPDPEDGMCRDGICRDVMCRDSDYGLNKYVIGSINLLKKYDTSVTLLPTLSDVDYDNLLTQNVVFLKLVDAAAVNTVLECIMRETPLVVNRHPAIVEVLGEGYPLYYDDLQDVVKLLSIETIFAAHQYLFNLDKEKFTIDSFMTGVTNSIIYENL